MGLPDKWRYQSNTYIWSSNPAQTKFPGCSWENLDRQQPSKDICQLAIKPWRFYIELGMISHIYHCSHPPQVAALKLINAVRQNNFQVIKAGKHIIHKNNTAIYHPLHLSKLLTGFRRENTTNNLKEKQMQSHVSLSNADFKWAKDVTKGTGTSKELCGKRKKKK